MRFTTWLMAFNKLITFYMLKRIHCNIINPILDFYLPQSDITIICRCCFFFLLSLDEIFYQNYLFCKNLTLKNKKREEAHEEKWNVKFPCGITVELE